jgi:phage repressor protein C with HTH and peptisase S24 domain
MTTQHSGDRLREILKNRQISPTEMAAMLGVSTQTLNNWFIRGVPGKSLLPVATRLGVFIEWLHSGEGPQIDADSLSGAAWRRETEINDELSTLGVVPIREWDDSTPLEDDEVSVPFLREVELAAGSGRFAIEEGNNAQLRFGKRSLRQNGVQFDKARCVVVRGSSMLPVLRDGATVGINTGKNSLGDIVDGDLYALNHNGQLRIKQVYRLPAGIRLRSFNRDDYLDEDYSFQDMQDQNLTILGHVFWWGMFAR